MKIQIASDLHLEFDRGARAGIVVDTSEERDLLILAGDIELGTKADEFILEQLEFSDVLYILGNHEGYKNVLPKVKTAFSNLNPKSTTKRINRQAKELGYDTTFYFLENDAVEIDGVRFLGCTLWTDFQNENAMVMNYAQQKMNDFHIIYESESKDDFPRYTIMRPEVVLGYHKKSVEFLKEELAKEFDGKTIVVTHHLPSWQSIAYAYKDSDVNGAYASDLEYLMYDYQPDIWIHGHTHSSFDYMVDNTRILCNPRGYFPNQLNGNYNSSFIIEV